MERFSKYTRKKFHILLVVDSFMFLALTRFLTIICKCGSQSVLTRCVRAEHQVIHNAASDVWGQRPVIFVSHSCFNITSHQMSASKSMACCQLAHDCVRVL